MELVIREYLGNKIQFEVRGGEVYANANSMATSKKIENWKTRPKTKAKVERVLKITPLNLGTELIQSKVGGNSPGTWIHETLLINFAYYVSEEFADWMEEQIATLLREGTVSVSPRTRSDMMIELFGNTPQTHAMIQLDEKLEIAIKTKAEIGSKREATAMATASVKSREANKYKKVIETEVTKYRPAHIIKRYNLGISSQEFNKTLEREGMQYKDKKLWFPCEGFEGMLVEYTDIISGHKTTGWTDKGVEVILEIFNNLGIYN